MGISIAKFDTQTKSNSGIEIELHDARTGGGSGAFITIKGTDSDTFRAISAERYRAGLERIRGNGGKSLTAAEVSDDECELLAACTVSWRGLDGEDGQPLPFSVAQAKLIYLGYPLIREQIDRAMGDRTAFLLA